MAYDPYNISALTYANGFTLWHYKSSDTEIDPGYFNDASAMVRPGDFMFYNLGVETVQAASGVFVIVSVTDGVVKLCDISNTMMSPCEA